MGHSLHHAALGGRAAIIFDGGMPITGAISQALAAAGMRVIVAGSAETPHDENDAASWQSLLDAAGEVHFAVIAPAPDAPGGLANVTPSAFQSMEGAQIVRPWLIFRHMLPELANRNPAAFVLVMSNGGMAPASAGIAESAAFGALRSMFKSVVLECGESMPSVRVNAVIIDAQTPADHVADAVMHLLSPDARFMTGAELQLGAS